MADSIVKIRIDTQEYDEKLKRASDALSRYFDTVKRGEGTLEVLDEGVLDAIKALGQMETVANNSKGKLREYTQAINDLTVQYRNLTDAEKNGDVGKALSASLDQLKAKAAQIKDAMSDVNQELTHLSSDTAFSDGMSMMARSVGSVGTAIVALTGNSKEMKAVLMDIAKIQATVQAVESLTKAFQKQNLVLMKNPYVLAASAIAALGVAVYEYVKKTDDATDSTKKLNNEITSTASKAEIASNSLQSLIQSIVIKNIVDDAESEFNKLAKTYIEGTDKVTKAWGDWQEAQSEADKFGDDSSPAARAARATAYSAKKEWEKVQKETDDAFKGMQVYQDRLQAFSSTFIKPDKSGKTDKPGKDDKPDIYAEDSIRAQELLVADLTDKWNRASAELRGGYLKELNEAKKKLDEMRNGIKPKEMATGFSGATQNTFDAFMSLRQQALDNAQIGSAEWQNASRNIIDTKSLNTLLNEAFKRDISISPDTIETLLDNLFNGDVITEDLQSLTETINSTLEEGVKPIKINFDTGELADIKENTAGPKKLEELGKANNEIWGNVDSILRSTASALGNFNEPALDIAVIVMNAVVNVASAFAKSLKGTASPWDYIAGAVGGAAAMTSAIVAIKAAARKSKEGFSEGGIIPGNYYSGDQLSTASYGIQSGELVLNRAQAGVIANQLSGGSVQSVNTNATISGENIRIVLRNAANRRGMNVNEYISL